VASTSDLDRDKDIIEPSAFKETIGSFKANPVVLATHQHRLSTGSSPVIGSVIPDSITITDREVVMTIRFATTALGEEYWQLYSDGHMRAVSIGFIAIEWTDGKDEELGYIRTYTKIELLEISAVPVPSNRRALVRAKGYCDIDDLRDALKEVLGDMTTPSAELKEAKPNQELTEAIASVREDLDEIKSLLLTDPSRLAGSLLGGGPDSPDCGGDNTNAELQFNRMKSAFKLET
jgi:HK97 family phage prohead protease